MNKMNSP